MEIRTDKSIVKAQAAAEGAAAVAVLIATLTIGAELWSPLKDFLKAIFTHHWIGKSALAVLLFAVVFFVRSSSQASASMQSLERAVYAAIWAHALSSIAIISFFVVHALFF